MAAHYFIQFLSAVPARRSGSMAALMPEPRGGSYLVLIRIQPYLDYGEHTLTKSYPARPGHSRWKPRYQSDAAPSRIPPGAAADNPQPG